MIASVVDRSGDANLEEQLIGHIPLARNVLTTSILDEDETFKDPDELRKLYREFGISGEQSVITYGRVGDRSSIEWFV